MLWLLQGIHLCCYTKNFLHFFPANNAYNVVYGACQFAYSYDHYRECERQKKKFQFYLYCCWDVCYLQVGQIITTSYVAVQVSLSHFIFNLFHFFFGCCSQHALKADYFSILAIDFHTR